MKLGCVFLLPITMGCGQVRSSPDAGASLDVSPRCDPSARFGAPVQLPGLAMVDGGYPRLSADELTIYFHTYSPGKLWSAHRSALTEAFGAPALLAAQNSTSDDYDPAESADGLTLWFASFRVANEGEHLYISTRASSLANFGAPGLASRVNAADPTRSDAQPFPTMDGSELWFTSNRAGGLGGSDIWRASWTGSEFATPVNVPELNSSSTEYLPTVSADRLTVYFSSQRAAPGVKGQFDIWTSHRNVVDDGFPPPTLVDELNTTGSDFVGWLSADSCRLYGVSNAEGPNRFFMATRQP